MFQKACILLYWICAIIANTFADIGVFLIVLSIAMTADTILWALKHYRLNQFSSRELKRGIVRKISLVASIAVTSIVLNNLPLDHEWLHIAVRILINTAISWVAVAELISVFQNWIVMKTWVDEFTEQDAITTVVKRIRNSLRSLLNKLFTIWQ